MSFPTFCAILANFGLVCLLAGGIKSSAARMRLALACDPVLCTPQEIINALAKRVLVWSLVGLFGWACLITALVAFLIHWL